MILSDFFESLTGFLRLPEENRELAEANVALELSVRAAQTQAALALEQLKHANDVLYNTKKDTLDQASKIVDLEGKLEASTSEVSRLQVAVGKLKSELALETIEPESSTPAFLDTSKSAYSDYQRVEDEDVYLAPGEVYDPNKFGKKWVASNQIRALPKNEKLMAIWDYTTRCASYASDKKVDNHQFPVQTVRRARGDCEDTAGVFVALCLCAGVSAAEVFNAVGPTQFGYHSYPIALADASKDWKADGKSFFIFESTLDALPSRPKKLAGSVYHVDSLANWRYSGQPFPEAMNLFNGAVTAAGGELQRVDNSEEKRNAIIEYWKEEGETQ